jgi:hypothetical protein
MIIKKPRASPKDLASTRNGRPDNLHVFMFSSHVEKRQALQKYITIAPRHKYAVRAWSFLIQPRSGAALPRARAQDAL